MHGRWAVDLGGQGQVEGGFGTLVGGRRPLPRDGLWTYRGGTWLIRLTGFSRALPALDALNNGWA